MVLPVKSGISGQMRLKIYIAPVAINPSTKALIATQKAMPIIETWIVSYSGVMWAKKYSPLKAQ